MISRYNEKKHLNEAITPVINSVNFVRFAILIPFYPNTAQTCWKCEKVGVESNEATAQNTYTHIHTISVPPKHLGKASCVVALSPRPPHLSVRQLKPPRDNKQLAGRCRCRPPPIPAPVCVSACSYANV